MAENNIIDRILNNENISPNSLMRCNFNYQNEYGFTIPMAILSIQKEIPLQFEKFIDVNITNCENMNLPMIYMSNHNKLFPLWMLNNLNFKHKDIAKFNILMSCVVFCKIEPPSYMVKDFNVNDQTCKGDTLASLYYKTTNKYPPNWMLNGLNLNLYDDNGYTMKQILNL